MRHGIPGIRQYVFSSSVIGWIIQMNPLLALRVGFQCGVVEY